MAIEGLEIAPGGIGSGEAQIFKTPFTEKAFLYAVDSENKRKAREEEEFASELGKIDTNGIHSPDAEEINNRYQELIDAYANVKQSRDRNTRLKNKVLYEQKKKDLLLGISQSKEYSKKLFNIGDKIIGSEKGAYSDDAINKFKQYRNMPSTGVVIDEFEFMKQPKEEDLLKVKSEIIKYSSLENQGVAAGSVGGRPGAVTTTKYGLDPQKYVDGWSMKLQEKPETKTYLTAMYKDQYEKSADYAKNGDAGFLQYAVTQEYLKDNAAEAKKRKQGFNAFYIPNDNNSTINFGGGGNQTRAIPTTQQPSSYLDITSTFQVTDPQNPSLKKNATRREKIPVYNRVKYSKPFPVDLSESGGYYSIDQNKIVSPSTEIVDFDAIYILDVPYAETPSGFKPISDESVKKLKSQGKESAISYIPSIQGRVDKSENVIVRIDQIPENILDEKDFIRAYEKYQQGGGAISGNTQAPAKVSSGVTDVGSLFKNE